MEDVTCARLMQRFATAKTLCEAYDIGIVNCRRLINKMRALPQYRNDMVIHSGKIYVRVNAFEEFFITTDIRRCRR